MIYPSTDIRSYSRIKDLITFGDNLSINHEKLHLHKVFKLDNGNKLKINFSAVFDRYYHLLKDKALLVTLTDEEFAKYKFQPKLLCYEVYGDVELAPLILRINNMLSVTEFTKQEVYLFKNDIYTLLNEILTLEAETIDKNISEAEKEIKE